jgi:hypothetical protein
MWPEGFYFCKANRPIAPVMWVFGTRAMVTSALFTARHHRPYGGLNIEFYTGQVVISCHKSLIWTKLYFFSVRLDYFSNLETKYSIFNALNNILNAK